MMDCRTWAVGATVAFLVLGGWATPSHAAVVFVSTGHTGANVQCDENHTQYWTYSVSARVDDVVGGLFDMKEGSKTTEAINFRIFEGTFADLGTAMPLLSVTLGPTDFEQDFGPVLFQGAAISLYPDTICTGVLSSIAPDKASEAYFVKGGALSFVDGVGNPANPGGNITAPVPEPATLSLLVLGGVAVLIRRRNRR